MVPRITRDILESYLNCQSKAHLKLQGQQGIKSDYECMVGASRQEVKRIAIDKILARYTSGDVVRDIPLAAAALRRGPAFVLDTALEERLVSLAFDGLMRVDGPSKLGDFHYTPVLFYEGLKIGKQQRLLLEVYGLLLSRLQEQMPSSGMIWHGKECRTTRVRLNGDLRKTERLLRDIKEMVSAESPPRLILNNHCQICEFRQRCHEQAAQEDNLSLLRGIGEKEINSYAKKGILTITQLAHTFRPRRRGKRSPPKHDHHYHALQALALRDKTVYLLGTHHLPDAPVHVYLDIEGKPDERFDYLIGMLIVEGDKEKRFSLWADDKGQEEQLLDQFLRILEPYHEFIVFAYGGYEGAFLKRMRQRVRQKAPVDRILKALVNVLSPIYSHVYFPTYSNTLKAVAALLGCSWTAPDASGVQSLVWRDRWENGQGEEWKQKLVTYNLDDCLALKRVTDFLYTQWANPEPALGQRSGAEAAPIVASVDEIDRLGTVNRRGRKEFFHSDFSHINRCARFDYQRQRVYIRSRKFRRKANRREPRKWRNRTLRVNQRFEITSRKCPSCGSSELSRLPKGSYAGGCCTKGKKAFDLVLTSGGIKRKVVECIASIHRCLKCGHTFVPDRYQRLAKHFHGLMSWAMHEHVAHRIGCPIVSDMIGEFFGLTVYPAEVTRLRAMMARYYQSCYKKVLRKILSSNVLQIDETEVNLRNGKGYVWVFTTSEEVVYMYRPTREGDFLHDLLKDFHGVLVTDFYAAYDSIHCPQQKCLLHLMRDMNQDLLDNPYDEELQLITGPFGALLRGIVVTIDEHGLKKQHLRKHERDVAEFFASLEKQSFRSDAAEALRARLLKYQDKLFTFIQYDRVPWNNNNPENAIRRFAYYRDANPGRLKEAGLKEYLILLSLCQTCHYSNISFLRFLLSRKRDVDEFRQHPTQKCRLAGIEVYPKGVVRPDFRPKVLTSDGTRLRRKADND